MSNRLGKRSLPYANYLKSDAELVVVPGWYQKRWTLANQTGGAKPVHINWERTPDFWFDDNFQKLVQQARRLVDCIRSLPAAPLAATVGVIGNQAADLIDWMHRKDLRAFSDLTPDVCDSYIFDLAANKVGARYSWPIEPEDDEELEGVEEGIAEGNGESVGRTTFATYLEVLIKLYSVGPKFSGIPSMVLPTHPLRGRTPQEIAKRYAPSTWSPIPPMPLEVFNATTEAQLDWLYIRASDIIRLQESFLEGRAQGQHYRGHSYYHFTDKKLLAFTFDNGGSSKPWRPPLSLAEEVNVWNPRTQSFGTVTHTPGAQFKDLLHAVRDAASGAVQGGTGMRVSEFCGLEAEPRLPNGYPACIEICPSKSGFYEIFYVKGYLFKRRGRKVEKIPTRWVAGCRPIGTNSIPYPVHAILVLDSLFAPWRALMDTKALVVPLGRGMHVTRSPLTQSKIYSDDIRGGQDRFCRMYVNLPPQFAHWRISTHQWRKRLAQDIVRRDGSLLRAVADQLDHLRIATTEGSYTGTDPTFLRLIEDAAVNNAAQLMYSVIYEEAIVIGKTANETAAMYANFDAQFGDLSEAQKKKLIADYLRADGVRLWESVFGSCLFRPETARCHLLWKGRYDLGATGPLHAARCSEVCCKCENLVLDRRHLPYWLERVRQSLWILKLAKEAGDSVTVAIAKRDANQAQAAVNRLERAA